VQLCVEIFGRAACVTYLLFDALTLYNMPIIHTADQHDQTATDQFSG